MLLIVAKDGFHIIRVEVLESGEVLAHMSLTGITMDLK
jgi:hypothetical protein